jgi:hypothetical protein
MIKFSALIKLAPFPEDMKEDLISKEGQMSEDQKFRLSETAWQAISAQYQAKLQKTINDMMLEMANGQKNYSQNDFQEVKTKLYYEFSQLLSDSKDNQDLEEVKRKLEGIRS